MAIDTVSAYVFRDADLQSIGVDSLAILRTDDSGASIQDSNGTLIDAVLLIQGEEVRISGATFSSANNELFAISTRDVTFGEPEVRYCFFLFLYDSALVDTKVETLLTNYDNKPVGFTSANWPVQIFSI